MLSRFLKWVVVFVGCAYYVLTRNSKNLGDGMTQRLSKKVVDASEPCEKDTYIWDSALKGFGLKITPKGRKVYIVQYRVGGRGGRTRRVTIGTHGTLTPEQARTLAKNALGQVSSGIDPAQEKDKIRSGRTMNALLDKFDSEHILVKLKPKSQEDYQRNIRVYIKPKLGNILVHLVSRQDIARLHHSLRETPYVANRTVSVLSKFFNWCEKFGYRDDGKNPCRHIDKFKEKKRQRFLSGAEQIRLDQSLDKAMREKLVSDNAVYAIRLLSLTGARLGEILTLKWSYINFERNTLELPDSKTGAKTIYLNEPAKDILSQIVRHVENPYVICGSKSGGHIVNLQKSWRRVRALADLEDVRLHDLRHTFASVAVSSGMSLPMIGALLGHSQPRTTARYAHLAADPLRAAAELIGQKISQAENIRI
ncbi:MAG: integrase [Alphaproteobacteria bacterium]|nr:MAG: integrase [Alphaproteobacteria bacterium]